MPLFRSNRNYHYISIHTNNALRECLNVIFLFNFQRVSICDTAYNRLRLITMLLKLYKLSKYFSVYLIITFLLFTR